MRNERRVRQRSIRMCNERYDKCQGNYYCYLFHDCAQDLRTDAGTVADLRKWEGRMAVSCRLPSLAMKQVSVESSGRRPNAKDVVSAMPVLNGKARARIRAVFFMAISRKLIRVMALSFTVPPSTRGCCQKLTSGLCDSHHNSEFLEDRRAICPKPRNGSLLEEATSDFLQAGASTDQGGGTRRGREGITTVIVRYRRPSRKGRQRRIGRYQSQRVHD
jgi:hypothetical protein